MLFRPDLDPAREEPLYRQLSSYIASLIDSGELSASERLPATRELAGLLRLNRATVSAAYELLEHDGLISGQVGRGSFVAARRHLAPALDWDRLLPRLRRESPALSGGAASISFAASRPPEELFPLDDFRQSCDEVLRSPRLGSILQLGSSSGYEPLRQHLIEDARREGAFGRDDDLLITNGCQQAIDLLRRALVRQGDSVSVEDPIYPGLRNAMLDGGVTLIPLRVGPQGLDAAGLRELRGVLAVLTPNFQNPTGLTMALSAREAALDAARHSGTVLVENDIYSALRYEGAAIPSLKQLAPEAGSVLLRSFSKVAFPGLRLGWVIGPRRLIAALREAKQVIDLHSDQFSQAVMLRFAESGRLEAHVAAMIAAGRERLGEALNALNRALPDGSRWTRPQGGLNLWITLPEGLDTTSLADRARREGVAYLPGGTFAVARDCSNALRLSFGGSSPAQLREGIRILGGIFAEEWRARQWEQREPAPALV